VVFRAPRYPVPETVDFPFAYAPVLLKRKPHILIYIRAMLLQEVILFPVEKHTGVHRVHVLIPVAAENHNIAQVAVFHPCLKGPFGIVDDGNFDIEFFLQDFGGPANLDSRVIGELRVNHKVDFTAGIFLAGSERERQSRREYQGDPFSLFHIISSYGFLRSGRNCNLHEP